MKNGHRSGGMKGRAKGRKDGELRRRRMSDNAGSSAGRILKLAYTINAAKEPPGILLPLHPRLLSTSRDFSSFPRASNLGAINDRGADYAFRRDLAWPGL